MKWTIAMVLLLAAGAAYSQPRIVAVEGSTTLEVKPDMVRIAFTIKRSDARDVAKAKAGVDKTSAKVVEALIQAGVVQADITSSALNVETDEKFDHDDHVIGVEHVVRREVDVILRKLQNYNAVVQALVDSNITEIESVRPDVSDNKALQRQALAGAVADARATADFLAGQLGAKVTRVHRIGRQYTQDRFSVEEIVVTAYKRQSGPTTKTTPYEFSLGTIDVASKIYVEFEIE